MEGIIYILILIVGISIARSIIVGIFSAIFGGGSSNSSSSTEFTVDLIQEFISTENSRLDCFTFKIRGRIGNPSGGSVKVICRLSDSTDEELLASIYAIPSVYHADSTGIFGISRTLPAADPSAYLPEFFTLGSVPKELLQYPYRGNRKIRVSAFLVDATCDESSIDSIKANIIEFSRSSSSYKVTDIGYMDQYENRDRTNELSIDLCMMMAASDGTLDQSEINTMKDWAKSSYVFLEDGSEKTLQKDKISAYIKNSYAKAKKQELNKESLTNEINSIFDTTAKYNLIELLLKIAGADDLFAKEEDEFLDTITNSLQLDQATVNEMKNKVVIGIKNVDSSESSYESLFGVTDNMSNEEKRKSLRQAYSKWNGQTTHKDGEIRKRAKEMINIIAKLNTKYKN